MSPPPLQILVAEKSRSLAGLLVGLLESANYTVEVATTEDEALELVRTRNPEVVLSAVSRFDGESLCKRLRRHDRNLPIALIYPPTRADDVEARTRMLGADLCLIGPVQRPALLSAVRLLMRLRRLQIRAAVDDEVEITVPGEGAELLDFPTFKKMVQAEAKKSRRYRFPASFILVQLDQEAMRARGLDRAGHAKLIGGVLAVLTRALRDVDLCVHTGDDRFVIFLPHTPQDGAQIVSGRLHERIGLLTAPRVASSVGVAAYDGHGQVSFGSLLRDATLALKRAQAAGGDRVEHHAVKRRERITIA